MAFRQLGAAAAVAVTLAFAASPARAVTEIQWWHAMTGPNNDVVVKLANDFNASQSDYKIVRRIDRALRRPDLGRPEFNMRRSSSPKLCNEIGP